MKKNNSLNIFLGILYYLLLIIGFTLIFAFYFFLQDTLYITNLMFCFSQVLFILFPWLFKYIYKKPFYQSVLYSFLAVIICTIIFIFVNIFFTKTLLIIDEHGGVGEGTSFNGEYYNISTSFAYTREGKLIGKAGGWSVYEIPEDINHNFIVFRSFLDNWAAVKESYSIPKSGNINVIYIDNTRYTNNDIKSAVDFLINEDLSESFKITTTDICSEGIYIGYEDCPVGTEKVGELCYINEKLVYIKSIKYNNEELENSKDKVYTCYVVPEKHVKAFKKVKYIPKNN